MKPTPCTCLHCLRTFGYGGEPRGYYCSDECAQAEVARQLGVDRREEA